MYYLDRGDIFKMNKDFEFNYDENFLKTCFGELSFVWGYLCRKEVLEVEHGRHADHETNPQQDHVHDPEPGKKTNGK